MIIWHVLVTGKPYTDLGPDFYTSRTDPEKKPSGSSPSSKRSALAVVCHPRR